MNLQEIDNLIIKYEDGETSLYEERLLHDFFKGENVPAHLKSYREMFLFYNLETQRSVSGESLDEKILNELEKGTIIPFSQSKKKIFYSIAGIAATIIILIGLFFQFGIKNNAQITVTDTYNNPELAYLQARRALMMVSKNLNEGLGKMADVSEFNNGLSNLNNISTFETGVQNLEKISIIEKSKKMITLKQ